MLLIAIFVIIVIAVITVITFILVAPLAGWPIALIAGSMICSVLWTGFVGLAMKFKLIPYPYKPTVR